MNAHQHSSYREATIFIVDDDDIDAMTLTRSLKKMKILNPVCRARDGQEALDLLTSGRIAAPFIILLDLNMPRMGGIEFLKAIRADPDLTGTVVFMLTTSKSDEDVSAAYRDHVAGYIYKQEIDGSFMDVVRLIEHYWKIVELPYDGRAISK